MPIWMAVTAVRKAALSGTEGPRGRSRLLGLPLVLAGVVLTAVTVAADAAHGRLGATAAVAGLYAVAAVAVLLLVRTGDRAATAPQADELLGEKERVVSLLQATLDSTVDGILVVDAEGRIAGLNKRFVEMWGIPGEIVASGEDERALAHALEQLEDPDAFLARVQELYARPHETSFDVLAFRDGRIFERYSRPQELGGRTVGRVWSFHDVTEQRRLEQELRQSQKMEAVGRLAGGVAHDFNNLLTAIIGYTEVLQAKLAGSPLHGQAAKIRAASDQAATLTRQLLAVGRKQILQPLPLDLNEVVSAMADLLRTLIGKNVELELRLAPDLGIVEVDRGQIEQVVLNLAINAHDAMPSGGRLTIETANVDGDEPWVLLRARDTGCGMDEETKARIFEPFFTTKAKEHSGLGLSTVFGVVEQSGGTIDVHSVRDEGTVFSIRLPRAEGVSSPAAAEPDGPTGDPGAGTILLVEDETVVRELIREVLAEEGYDVIAAACGQEALDATAGHAGAIDLVLTDLVMPGMSGIEVAEGLLAIRPRIKVLYMSGYTDEKLPISLGSDSDFLQKPFTMSELAAKVRELLDPPAAAAA